MEQYGTDEFIATYEVEQQTKENDQTKAIRATYLVRVHMDTDNILVIIKTPALAKTPDKSTYESITPEANGSFNVDTIADATSFLDTFFKLYPTATEKELAYYVQGNVLEVINCDYLYSELINPVFTRNGENVNVKVSVKFIDNQTKAMQILQYDLTLQKKKNWMIIK